MRKNDEDLVKIIFILNPMYEFSGLYNKMHLQ